MVKVATSVEKPNSLIRFLAIPDGAEEAKVLDKPT